MILDIDIGNTRLKWRLTDQAKINDSGIETGFLHEMLSKLLIKTKNKSIKRIRVAHVLGGDREKEIAVWGQEKLSVAIEFARSIANYEGVVNGYAKPERLGVDRWLAILAAFKNAQQACCVVDCGSATTIDFISNHGCHEGGYIVPGLRLMHDSLAKKTAQLPLLMPALEFEKIQHGKTTEKAMHHGILQMNALFIQGAVSAWRDEQKSSVILYATGGDADIVKNNLVLPDNVLLESAPDLVLDGLSIALP